MKSDAIYIALGANLPYAGRTPRETLALAAERLAGAGVSLIARSSDWHSPSWPDPTDPSYVNAVAEVETGLDAARLLACLHTVEGELGRARTTPNAPRPIDLDLIDYRGRTDATRSGLVIPHPRATQRAFVLLPLQEIAPAWRDPVSGRSIGELVAGLPRADVEAMYTL